MLRHVWVNGELQGINDAGAVGDAHALMDHAPVDAVLPAGGVAKQLLEKIDSTDYNARWVGISSAVLSHSENTIFVDKSAGTDWSDWEFGAPHEVGDVVICGAIIYRCIQAYLATDAIAEVQMCSSDPDAYKDYWEVYPWGQSMEQAFASIGQALRVVRQGVSGGQGIIVGAGLYEENIVVPSRVFLIGQAAALEGTIKLGYQAFVAINRHFAAGNDQVMVEHIATEDVAMYTCDKVRSNGRLEHESFPFTGVKVLQNDREDTGLIAKITQCILGEDSELIHTLAVSEPAPEAVNVATDPDKFSGNNDSGTIGNLSETQNVSSWTQFNYPAWVEYDMGEGNTANVNEYTLRADMSLRAPRVWTVKGSNNGNFAGTQGTDWWQIDSRSLSEATNPWISQNTHTHSITTNQNNYRYYRIDFTEGYSTRLRLNLLTLVATGGTGFAGGEMLFDVDDIRLNDGAVIASSKCACNAWRGTIKEARYAPDTSGGIGFEVTEGSVMVSGQNLASDLAYDVSGGELIIDFLNMEDGVQTGGVVVDLAALARDALPSVQPILKDYTEEVKVIAGSGALTLDFEEGNVFEVTVDDDVATTLSLDNVREKAQSLTLHLIQHADDPVVTLDWTTHWSSAEVPTFVPGLNVLTFHRLRTTDPWLGHLVGQGYGAGA